MLRKAEDYIEPRIGPEYQATDLPPAAPARAVPGASKARPLYSVLAATEREERTAVGPQHDVLLDEVSATERAIRRPQATGCVNRHPAP